MIAGPTTKMALKTDIQTESVDCDSLPNNTQMTVIDGLQETEMTVIDNLTTEMTVMAGFTT